MTFGVKKFLSGKGAGVENSIGNDEVVLGRTDTSCGVTFLHEKLTTEICMKGAKFFTLHIPFVAHFSRKIETRKYYS